MTRFPAMIAVALILGLTVAASCSPGHDNRRREAIRLAAGRLDSLDVTILSQNIYEKVKRKQIDSLRNATMSETDLGRRRNQLLALSELYRLTNADSAIRCASEALNCHPAAMTQRDSIRGELVLVKALATGGLFHAALTHLDSIHKGEIPDLDTKLEYWKASRVTYSYASSYIDKKDPLHNKYHAKGIECDDSLMRFLPADDKFRTFIYNENLVRNGMLDEAKEGLGRLMADLPAENNIYGMAAYQLAQVYKRQQNYKGYTDALATAAQSDIMGVVREGLAIPELAKWLYEEGEYERAHRYINFALDNANSGNIRTRTVTISTLLPIIDHTHREALVASHNSMQIYAVTSTVLFVITAALAVLFLRTTRRTRANEKNLESSRKKLEAYVGHFMELCSSYSSRLDQLTRLVTRKINSGQTDDLLKMINSGKINEQDSEDFYPLVDKAILDLFPDFVDNINTLLQPDKKIELKAGEVLTPELRIYAFVRLGVDQSTKIAQVLHYSVNTVYAYRNRMRNRAINRETFDSDVANIGSKINLIDNLPI